MGEGGLSGPCGNVWSRMSLRIAPASSSMPAMFGIRCLSTAYVLVTAGSAHLVSLARWQDASGANTATHLDTSLNCHSLGLGKV